MSNPWGNLASIVYKRTYARPKTKDTVEGWKDTVERVIRGNVKDHNVTGQEIDKLKYLMLNRKAMLAGRGIWYSGTESHDRLGSAALNNCWFTTADDYHNFVLAQDLLMLGGGLGMSIEHRFVSKLPKVKKNVTITHKDTKDADYIVPDSREGWNDLSLRFFESFFKTGKSFNFSTVCLRSYGAPIKGFGGVASGPNPLIEMIEKLSGILKAREGKHLRPIDAMDILCCIGEMVVSGNVRRSALIILGDAWDKEYLKSKRWDLNIVPSYRAYANLSVVVDDVDDLHPLFWETYKNGEPFGIINRKNIQKYGRMGELKKDTAVGVNPCAEATLEDGEPCNLQEVFLPNLADMNEFTEAVRLMHRAGKRITMGNFHHDKNLEVVRRNRRIGTGLTGALQAPQFWNADSLDHVYAQLQKENIEYSATLNIPESIRTTVIKPSGTLSLVGEVTPGIHSSYSRYYIRRVRFAANDKLIPVLKAAGHHIEQQVNLDGSFNPSTLVVDFYCQTPDNTPCADEGFDTWKQLNTLLFAQKHWADQAVSVTIYYKKEDIGKIKLWLADNLSRLKTISFLCHNDHGFKQAPLEAITKENYEKLSSKVKPIDFDSITQGSLESMECEGGACPIK